MKFFNLTRKYKYQEENTVDGGDGSTAPNTDNNNANKPDNFDDVWYTGTNDNSNSSNETVQRVEITNQTPVTELTPQQKLNAHIESLNLADGFDMEAMQSPETAVKEMERMQALTYSAAMKDTNTLIQQAVASVKEELSQQTQDTVNGNAAISMMNSELTYTSSPALKPIADSLLVKFQNKGQSVEEAVASVGKYFNQMSQNVSKTLPQSPNNRMRGGNFSNSNNGNQNQADDGGAEDQNWVNFLTAS